MSIFVKKQSSRSARVVMSGIAVASVSALLLAGCATATKTKDAMSGAPKPSDGAQSVASGDRDLTLKIGTILPQSGALAFLGPPEEAGVKLAVKEINEAKLGIKVDLTLRDSGDTKTDTATTSVTDLLKQNVTAIVGAASSGVSLTVIDQISAANVVQFSPANTSPTFTDYKDNDFYWRSAPSDVYQGEVLGNLIAKDGVSTLGMIVLNDPYGTGLAANVKKAFEGAGGKVVAEPLFNEGDSSFDAQISTVIAAKPDAIVLITFDQAKVITPALVGAGFPGGKLYFVDGNLADFSKDFAPGLITGSKGTLPGAKTASDFQSRLLAVDPNLKDFSYASESYDAVILLALAAYAGKDTSGPSLKKFLQQVSGGTGKGEKATSFKAAAELLKAGKQVDYDGASGPITFNEKGDPTEATIGVYQYKADNKYVRID